VHAEHAALYAATDPVTQLHSALPRGSELTAAAVRSLDAYRVTFIEACRRGDAATGDPAFAAAAETVTGCTAVTRDPPDLYCYGTCDDSSRGANLAIMYVR
jgi:hypothetical protein